MTPPNYELVTQVRLAWNDMSKKPTVIDNVLYSRINQNPITLKKLILWCRAIKRSLQLFACIKTNTRLKKNRAIYFNKFFTAFKKPYI